MIESLNKYSELVESVGQSMSILSSSLGFLGLECLLLLTISFILLFFVNQINAIYPKFNYFFVILISVILALITGMSFLGLVKYFAVMALPIILSVAINQIASIFVKKFQ